VVCPLLFALPKMLHEQSGAIGPLRCEQKMDVVRHEHVGVNGATVPGGLFMQSFQISPVILFGVETGAAVVTALDDVPGNTGNSESRSAGHNRPPCRIVLLGKIVSETEKPWSVPCCSTIQIIVDRRAARFRAAACSGNEFFMWRRTF